MATLNFGHLFGSLFQRNESHTHESPLAREFAEQAYQRFGGATQELRRVYRVYTQNQSGGKARRREARPERREG